MNHKTDRFRENRIDGQILANMSVAAMVKIGVLQGDAAKIRSLLD
ncbi:MAG: hypothetical protein ACK4IX_06710, partial [Candidatus Sericytochromatia bacterium]